MGIKVFSALHEIEKNDESVHFIERKSGVRHLWAFGHFPISNETGNAAINTIIECAENELIRNDPLDEQESFEAVLKTINERLTELFTPEESETILRNGGIILAFLSENILLISSYGQGEIFLFRDNSLLEISEGLSPVIPGDEFFQNISSGDIKNGDKIVFSTIRLQRFVTERQLSSFLSDGVTEGLESIVSAIDSGESCAILVTNMKSADPLSLPEKGKGGPAQISNPFHSHKKDFLPHFNFFQENIALYLKKLRGLPSSVLLLLGACVLAIILFFLFFSLISQEEGVQKNNEFSEFVSSIENQFSNVDTHVTLGKLDQANLVLDRMEEKAREMLVARIDVTNAEQILRHIEEKRAQINRVIRIVNPEIFSDFKTTKDDIAAKEIMFLDNEFLVHDGKSLFKAISSTTPSENVGILSSSDTVKLFTRFPAKNEIVFMTQSGSIFEWKNDQVTSADTADTTWKSAIDMSTYSKYLYFLSPSDNMIWKYERRDSGYTIPEEWITDETRDIKNAISFTIDGSVYILMNTGEIQKYYRGERTSFEVKDIPGGALTGSIIFTDEALRYLYILDTNEKKITILEKSENEAVYKQQIILENTEKIVDLYVTETQLYILGEQKIYVIPLPQS